MAKQAKPKAPPVGLTREGAQELLAAYRAFWSEDASVRWQRGEAQPGTPLGDLCVAFLALHGELEQTARWGPERQL